MFKKLRYMIYLFILTALICISFFTKDFLFGFRESEDIGKLTIMSEKLSPDSKNKAVSFRSNAGATTAYGYHLSILKPHRRLKNMGGNAFLSYSEFDFEWVSDNEILVTVRENGHIFHQHSQVGNVNITYVHDYRGGPH